MKYALVKDMVGLVEAFEQQNAKTKAYSADVHGFVRWIRHQKEENIVEPSWEGKEKGRTAESTIATLLVQLNRYAKMYGRAAIHHSPFSTQEDFIYLINLKAFGALSKMELIKKNVHEKPAGMKIINRLIRHGWVAQRHSKTDGRSKVIALTTKGIAVLKKQMNAIRLFTRLISATLTHAEKMELIRILNKLDHFHHAVYAQNFNATELIALARKEFAQN